MFADRNLHKVVITGKFKNLFYKNMLRNVVTEYCTSWGYLGMIRWFVEELRVPLGTQFWGDLYWVVKHSAVSGHFDVLKYVVGVINENPAKPHIDMPRVVTQIQYGKFPEEEKLEMLKWIVGQGHSLSRYVAWIAAQLGHCSIFRWALETNRPEELDPTFLTMLTNAPETDTIIDTLRWAIDFGFTFPVDMLTKCASRGILRTLRFAVERGCDWPRESILHWAAQSGNLETFLWVTENEPKTIIPANHRELFSHAAMGKNMEIIKIVFGQFNHIDRSDDEDQACWHCHDAARSGDLAILRWTREQGVCGWDAYTTEAAALAHDFESFRWAVENGCPWDEDTGLAAASGSCLELYRYAVDNGCPMTPEANEKAGEWFVEPSV